MRGESARPGKRPLRALSASEKMDAIQRVHEGESKASVARDIGVPESTLRGWCKSEHKIRGMARNSSTPDSEAHSPASSSGAANNPAAAAAAVAAAAAAINNVSAVANSINNSTSSTTNLSSEDEGPCAKKMKIDNSVITPPQQQQQQQHSPPTSIVTPATTSVSFGTVSTSSINAGDNHLLTDADSNMVKQQQDTKPKIDYVSLMASMANMRPENSSLLLQQLGLLSGATAGSLAQSLLSMTQSSLAATASATTTQHGGAGSAVGLVENGLQYTKSNVMLPNGTTTGTNMNGTSMNVGGSSKRHSISAIAPTQMDSVVAKSCSTRKSLPPAAEAPSTPVPASPRKTNDNNNMQRTNNNNNNIIGGNGSSKAKKENSNIIPPSSTTSNTTTTTSSGNRKVDEALWLWLTQQQKLLTQQSTSFMPSINQQDGSWFWQWYKQCSFPLTAPTPVPATPTSVAKKSPSKAKALLDNVLCNNNNNNNNENIVNKRVLSMDGSETTEDDNNGVPSSTEEAIEHGEKFFKWLDRCSEPAVTRLQIMQFKYLLDNLKSCRKKTSSLKQSRK